MRFTATVELHGQTATGFAVPESVITALGSGHRPKVVVTIGGYSYRSSVAPMRGQYLIPLSAENRSAAGVSAGAVIEVELELDAAPREVILPDELAALLTPAARAHFDALAFTHRKEWVRWIEEAKRPETRSNRIAQTAAALAQGRVSR